VTGEFDVVKKAVYAHTLTFPEMRASKSAVVTLQGVMVDGPDCKMIDDRSKWCLWQKAVQKACQAGLAPQNVVNYFQATKSFTAPPQGDIIVPDHKPAPFKKAPPFTWSPSKLNSFEICPAKFAAEAYYKIVPYQETVYTIWGNKCHKESENFFKKEKSVDAEAFRLMEPFLKLLDRLPGDRLVEFRMGLTAEYKAVECPNIPAAPWNWGTEAKGRMTLDLGFLNDSSFRGFDWKTGKPSDNLFQLQLYALTIALLYPQVQDIEMKFIWVKDKSTSGFKCTRKELLPIFKDVKERVSRMEEAWVSETFVERKNGLCRAYCGNFKCPHFQS
jgi:hypothetical protein